MFPTISLKFAKFQSVKNKAPCKRLSHICAHTRPLPGSVGVVGAVAKLTYFAIKTVATENFLPSPEFFVRQCRADGRCGNMADTDKKGGVLRGFPKPACHAVFSGVWSKEKKQGTYFKIRALYFKISQTYFLPPENYIETCPEKADKNRRCFYARCERHFPCRLQHMQNRLCSRRIVKFWPIFEKLRLLCPSIMKILL